MNVSLVAVVVALALEMLCVSFLGAEEMRPTVTK
jgi:hypothetical protein